MDVLPVSCSILFGDMDSMLLVMGIRRGVRALPSSICVLPLVHHDDDLIDSYVASIIPAILFQCVLQQGRMFNR